MKIARLEVFESDGIFPHNPDNPTHLSRVVANDQVRMWMLPGGAVVIDWGEKAPQAKQRDLLTYVGPANVKTCLIVMDEAEKAKLLK